MGASSRRTRLSAAASNQETENINPQMDSAPETNMASPTPLEDEDEGALRSKEDMIREFVTCKICDGYIIDATTIDPCLHSFCKPCIYKRWRFFKSCPQCQELLGPNPKEQLKSDHTVQNLIYKLVPNLQKLEKERLRKYEEAHPPAVGQPSTSFPDTPSTRRTASLRARSPVTRTPQSKRPAPTQNLSEAEEEYTPTTSTRRRSAQASRATPPAAKSKSPASKPQSPAAKAATPVPRAQSSTTKGQSPAPRASGTKAQSAIGAQPLGIKTPTPITKAPLPIRRETTSAELMRVPMLTEALLARLIQVESSRKRPRFNKPYQEECDAALLEHASALITVPPDALVAFNLELDKDWFEVQCFQSVTVNEAVLNDPYLKTKARATVEQIGKHLAKNLAVAPQKIELIYLEKELDPSWTLSYVANIGWVNPQPLILRYRPWYDP